MSEDTCKKSVRFVLPLVCTIVIHSIFVVQLLLALPRKGLILPAFAIPFLPQTFLMYFLPPKFSWYDKGFDWVGLVGQIIVAMPASFLYGVIIAYLIRRWQELYRKRIKNLFKNNDGSLRQGCKKYD